MLAQGLLGHWICWPWVFWILSILRLGVLGLGILGWGILGFGILGLGLLGLGILGLGILGWKQVFLSSKSFRCLWRLFCEDSPQPTFSKNTDPCSHPRTISRIIDVNFHGKYVIDVWSLCWIFRLFKILSSTIFAISRKPAASKIRGIQFLTSFP